MTERKVSAPDELRELVAKATFIVDARMGYTATVGPTIADAAIAAIESHYPGWRGVLDGIKSGEIAKILIDLDKYRKGDCRHYTSPSSAILDWARSVPIAYAPMLAAVSPPAPSGEGQEGK